MMEDLKKGHGLRSFLRRLCFISFGVTAFANPANLFNLVNLVYGILIGLLFGFLCKALLTGVLGVFNRDLKTLHGQKVISYAVDKGMTYMIPFAVMALLATFILDWSITGRFLSAGIMAAGVSASMEIAKLNGKQAIKNTLITSIVTGTMAIVWLFSSGFLGKIPPYLEGGASIVISLVGNYLK